MLYQHRFSDDRPCELPNGKNVCVGRNYAEHARELNNPIPKQPLLFIKPSTALAALDQPLAIPRDRGECHHELELALLIGQPLSEARAEETLAAIAGYGLALDLTLRELQSQLKEKGQPWEHSGWRRAIKPGRPATLRTRWPADRGNHCRISPLKRHP